MTSAKTAPGEGVERLGADRVYHALVALLETQADGGPAFGQRRRTVRVDLEVQASCRKWQQIILRCRPNPLHTAPPLRAIYGGTALPQRKLGSLQLFAAE